MALYFKYHSLNDGFSNDLKKPTIKITLHGKGKTASLDVYALLDSGADVSVIPKGLAEYLRLKFGKEDKAKGIGGEIKIHNSQVFITMKGKRDEKHYFQIPVQITENDNFPIIIGRRGFFDRFIITIDEKISQVKLKKRD